MKRLVAVLAVLVLTTTSASCIYPGPGSSGSSVPTNTLTPATSPSKSDAEVARDAGQAYVGRMADLYFPRWRRAIYGEPRLYQDLQGNTAAYLFPFARDGQMLGYVVVASERYGHSVLEVKRDEPLPPVTALRGQQPARLVYLGFEKHYAIYRIEGREVALDLKTGEQADASQLRFGLKQDGIDEWDMEKAKEVMQTERARAIGRGAALAEPLPLYDLDGNVKAYWFRFVEGEREVPAYVVVGNWFYDNRALRVWTKGDLSPIYFPPSPAEVRSAIEKDLGLVVEDPDIGPPVRMLYFWPSFLWAVYEIRGQEIAVEASTRKAATVSRLRAVARGEDLEEDIAAERELVQRALLTRATHDRWKEFEGSRPEIHQVYRNWEGEINSYYFLIVKDGNTIGYFVVGSLPYAHSGFESAGPVVGRPFRGPEPPGNEAVAAIVNGRLGMQVEEADIDGPVRFEFGGPTYHLAYYEIREEVIGIVINHNQAFRAWEMRPSSGLL